MSVATRSSIGRSAAPPAVPSRAASLRAVVRRGLVDHRGAPLSWGGSLGAFGALIALIWPSVEGSVSELMESYPEDLKEAFNITELSSVEQYVDAELLSLIVPLAVAFLAVRCVTRAISGAEEQRWLDTLLAIPLSREMLVAGTFAVTAVVVAVVLAVTTLLTTLAGVVVGADPSLLTIARGMGNVWPLAMFFAGLATLASGWLHRAAPVTAIAAGTLVAMYLVDVLGKIADPIEPLRWASAFRYYGSAVRDGIDPLAFAGLTAAAVLLAVVGALLFGRRDVLA